MPASGPIVRAAASPRRLRSSLLVGLVVCLAAAGLAAAINVRGDAASRVDAAFTRADAADLVLYVDPAAVEELRDVLGRDPRVERVGVAVASTNGELADRDRTPVEIRTTPSPGAFNAPVVTAGRLPAGGAEMLLDAALAGDAGIDVGDSLRIVTAGVERTLGVVGLGFDFSDCLYPNCDPVHAWVGQATFDELSGGDVAMMVPVDLDGADAVAGVVTEVRDQLGDDFWGSNDWPDTRGDLLVETDFFGAFLGAFGLFVLVSSAVVIASAIGARTIARRRAIALYKTIGFTGAQLTRSIMIEHLLIAVLASAAGWTMATLLSPALRIGPLRLLEQDGLHWDTAALLVTTAITVLIVATATLVPAWRAGRLDVTTALSGSARSRRRRPLLRAPGAAASDAPVPVSFAATAVTARPVRSAFNVIAIVVAVVAAIVSVSILRSIDRVVGDPAMAGDPGDVMLEPSAQLTPREVERSLDRQAAVGAWFSVADDTATIGGADVHLRAVGGDPSTNGFVVGAGRLPSGAGEAAAGYALLHQRGWQIGDRLTVAVGDKSFDVALVGWYRETEDSGELLQVRMEDYVSVMADVRPSYGVFAAPGVSVDALSRALTGDVGAASTIRPNEPDAAGLTPFRVAMGVMIVLITAVAVAHVMASVVTTQRESRRRLGVQRALGFDPAQLLAEGVFHGLTLATIALVVGIPLGWWAQRAIGDLLTSEIGIGPGLAFGPTAQAIAVIATATLVVGALATMAATLPGLRRSTDSLLSED